MNTTQPIGGVGFNTLAIGDRVVIPASLFPAAGRDGGDLTAVVTGRPDEATAEVRDEATGKTGTVDRVWANSIRRA